MAASLQDRSAPLLHTLIAFHARFCSASSPATMMPHVWSSNSDPDLQPMDLDLDEDDQDLIPSNSLLSDPIAILQTLASNPHSAIRNPNETLVIRDAFLSGPGEIRNGDLGNSASLEADVAADMASVFRVWDLNTQRPELENGTLTDVLKAFVKKTENCWFDDGQGFVSLRPTVDAFDMTEMRSALEGQMMETPAADADGGFEVSVAALARLLGSIL